MGIEKFLCRVQRVLFLQNIKRELLCPLTFVETMQYFANIIEHPITVIVGPVIAMQYALSSVMGNIIM
jgi:hypothetical protein